MIDITYNVNIYDRKTKSALGEFGFTTTAALVVALLGTLNAYNVFDFKIPLNVTIGVGSTGGFLLGITIIALYRLHKRQSELKKEIENLAPESKEYIKKRSDCFFYNPQEGEWEQVSNRIIFLREGSKNKIHYFVNAQVLEEFTQKLNPNKQVLYNILLTPDKTRQVIQVVR
jgi:hypothetical protein